MSSPEADRRRFRPWNRLGVKLAAAIVAVTLATIGAFAAISVRTQERRLIDEVVRGAALFSDTIKSSTYHDMLEDRRDDAYLIMDTIGRQERIEKVRIFNKEGRVTFSTDRSEISTLVDKRAESCYACHAADRPIARLAVPSRSRIYLRNHHRVLGMVTPIYNERSCSTASCHVHQASQSVLGVVDIGISLQDIDEGLADLKRRTAGLAGLSVIALAAIASLTARRFVGRPVAQLVEGTQRVARGDLAHEIPVRGSDEIGLLAASFNRMTHSLNEAQQEIARLLGSLEQQLEDRTRALGETQGQLIQAEKMTSLGKLAASIAHEINNPLSGILTYAKLLIRTLEDGVPDETARASSLRQLRLVERETQRCTAIVRNLLEFARQRPLTLKPLDINRPIEEALSLLANQFAIQGVAVVKRLDALPPVQADFGQLRQAFVNIILNACEAMGSQGGGTLTVASRMLPRGDAIEVELTDTGPGIAPDHLSRIFDPFFTTKEKGTGLGLSVVYGIVERHGGTLDIRSQAGQGTSVFIRLPKCA